MMADSLGFDDVAQALAAGGSAVHAAEAHGCLCGALCARRVYLPAEWMQELLPDATTPAATANFDGGPLGVLFARSKSVLEERDTERSRGGDAAHVHLDQCGAQLGSLLRSVVLHPV